MQSPEFYAREYNARERVPDHPRVLDEGRARSRQARQELSASLDLHYGPGQAETLDLFPARTPGGPLFVFIHGGYWRSLDKADFSFLAPALVAAGVNVALVNYALCPAVRIDDIVMQNVHALAWLYREAGRFGYDADRIHVGGHSAGGHLTAMMLCARFPDVAPDLPADLVKSGLAISGLYDLEPIVDAPFLSADLRLDRAQAERLSPAWMTPATSAPVVTAVGGDESSEFLRQNALLGERWPRNLRADVPMPGFNHFTVVGQLAQPTSPLFQAAIGLCGA